VHFLNAYEAMIVGCIKGVIATWGLHLFLHRLKLDDPLYVVATHGLAGAFGTLSIPFVAPVSALQSGSRLVQLGIQSIGIVGVFIFVSAVTWISMKVIGRFRQLRVSAEAEELGLNTPNTESL
jgi:Amt family ammonium transporter